MNFEIFVSCPKGLEYLLETELKQHGLNVARVSPQGVYGQADLAVIYQLCLWSRLANRIQVILLQGPAHDQATLYQLCAEFAWDKVFTVDKTFAIEFHGESKAIQNTMFGAQVVKDAIVDYWRNSTGTRPSVVRDKPDIRLHAHLKQGLLTVSLDVTGYSLHQRGYRLDTGSAPLKENIAAAMLLRAQWPELAAQGYHLHDPFCGAGTIVIEAAMMAANLAPGLLRDDQAVHAWLMHQPELWAEARQHARTQIKPLAIKLCGTDLDARAIRMARANAERAEVVDWIDFQCLAVDKISAAPPMGLLICNPPFGERLGEELELIPLFQRLGQVLHQHYSGWQAAILSSKPMLAKAIGLRAHKQYALSNGQLACKLYCFDLSHNQLRASGVKSNLDLVSQWSDAAQMFANRLQKNATHLAKWAKRNQIHCYRIYDADLPEYAYAIDVYHSHVVLQEYAPPDTIAPHLAEKRRLDVLQVVPSVLNIPVSHIIHKQRQAQKGSAQYQRLKTKQEVLEVQEGRAQFLVNLHDYLDTGLFLDHRLMRLKFAQLPPQTRFLNCFCYTATASVHAALAGAWTTNIDLSNTYLNWAQQNFTLNHLNLARHQFIQSDCLEWLSCTRDQFDVIFLDPPSFSNSKRMATTLDIQRDHEELIHAAMRLLHAGGVLYFSTNLRQFKLAPKLLVQYQIKNMTHETIDQDFKRNPKIHQCFEIKQAK